MWTMQWKVGRTLGSLVLGSCLLTGCSESEASSRIEPSLVAKAPVQNLESSPYVLSRSFPGRDPSLAVDASGRVHVAYVVESEESTRVAWRRLDPEPGPEVLVSPPELEVSSRREVPPSLQVLGEDTLWSFRVRD